MRSGSGFIPKLLLRGSVFLISVTCMFAQGPLPVPSATGAMDSVEAPVPTGAVLVENAGVQSPAQGPDESGTGNINGTVTDENGDLIPGSIVTLEGPDHGNRRTIEADDNGSFDFRNLKPGIPYTVMIQAKGFAPWTSSAVTLSAGQFEFLKNIELKPLEVTTITVVGSNEQIAVEQVQMAEKQRVLGFIPNFYVVYDANPAPLSAKLKFKLALRVSVDPVSFLGAAFLGGIEQAADTPNYVQGAKGYGQRVGAVYAGGLTDIMFGGAILPSLLHQDPRYYYRGTGSHKSRFLHAIANPFICKGDNGQTEINFSSIGGDLASSAITNAYYPSSNRGAGLVFENVLIDTGERTVSSLVQEFVLHKFTSSSKTR
jgi:hypothetical protein